MGDPLDRGQGGDISLVLEVFRHLPLGIHVYSLETEDRLVFLGANPAADQILGVDNRIFVGRTIEEAFPPLERTEVPAMYRRVALTGEPWRTEQITYQDERIVGAFAVHAFGIGPGKMAAAFRDITREKQAQLAMVESERRLREAQRLASLGSWELVPGRDGLEVSQETLRIFEFPAGTTLLSREAFLERVHPQDRARVDEGWRRAGEEGFTSDAVYRLHLPGGRTKWIHELCRTERTGEGHTPRTMGTVHDITAFKQAEEDVRESRGLYHDLVETAFDLIWQVDDQGRYTYLNPAWEEVLGYRVEEMLGKRFTDFQTPEYAARDREEFSRLLQGEFVRGLETVHRAKDGHSVHLLFNAKFVRDPTGAIIGTRGTAYDITRRKEIEEELRLHRDRFASLFRVARYGAGNQQQFLDFVLHEAVSLTGSRLGYLYGYDETLRRFSLNSWSREVMAECAVRDPQTCYELERTGIWGEAVRQRQPILLNDFRAEHPLKRGYPPGHVALERFLTVPVFQGEGIVAVVGVANKGTDYTADDILHLRILLDTAWSIMAQRRSDEALRESEARLAESQRVARIGHYVFEPGTGRWTSSKVLDEILGIGPDFVRDVAGWIQIVHPDHRQEMRDYLADQVLRQRLPFNRRYPIVRVADGRERWVQGLGRLDVDGEGRVTRMFGTIQDVTEQVEAEDARQRLEQKMLQAQKLESLGVLAGGIAHDFNNLLMAVMGNAELARLTLPAGSPAVEYLQEVLRASTRAADLSRQMLAYSGRGTFRVETVDLNQLVGETTGMLRVSISKKAALSVVPGEGIPCVSADATQLRQVLMNLVINASEALGEESGTITIATGVRHGDSRFFADAAAGGEMGKGEYVFLEVADTGCGMDRETLGRIFDPFFTTKFTGRGLGLAAVQGIVRGHRGALKVDSEPGRGTSVTVYLPAAAEGAAADSPVGPEENWRGSGRVLLVDDEEHLRSVARRMLSRLGFSVVEAADGQEAVDLYRAGLPFDLVIMDRTMPRMGGEEAGARLRELDARVPLVLSSGYSEQDAVHRLGGHGATVFLHKPYTLENLRRALREVLGERGEVQGGTDRRRETS
jgi:PAS domain S-box-containing protein